MEHTFDTWSKYGLDDDQKKAVMAVTGPLLVLAGAGAGKTTVLTQRVANILTFGKACEQTEAPAGFDDEQLLLTMDMWERAKQGNQQALSVAQSLVAVDRPTPDRVMAVTFTNKAADEMASRLGNMLDCIGTQNTNVSTIHKFCLRMLRVYSGFLGFTENVTVVDTDDAFKVLKMAAARIPAFEDADKKRLTEAQREISRLKADGYTPYQLRQDVAGGLAEETALLALFEAYQAELMRMNVIDFDDILVYAKDLLYYFPDVRRSYQEKLEYILVDEYQDVNKVQFEIIRMLADGHKNLCVVGDDDQSIYGFRGANVETILSFELHFPGCRKITLGSNYRSCPQIVEAAQMVIQKNQNRYQKDIHATRGAKGTVCEFTAYNAVAEAEGIARFVKNVHTKQNIAYSDIAVLFRWRSASRLLQEKLMEQGIPSEIVNGHDFLDSKTAKDLLAYLKLMVNEKDDLSMLRVMGLFSGFGDAVIKPGQAYAKDNDVTLWTAMERVADGTVGVKLQSRQKNGLDFCLETLAKLKLNIKHNGVVAGLTTLIADVYTEQRRDSKTGVLDEDTQQELTAFVEMVERNLSDLPGLEGLQALLDMALLSTDGEANPDQRDSVKLMTIHGAKGLEYRIVILAGADTELMPGTMPTADTEEERRNLYVAMTRAKDGLVMTHAQNRMLYDPDTHGPVNVQCHRSLFLSPVPQNHVSL